MLVAASLPVRKMKVEVFDETGNRYTISLEGSVTRKNALRILDMVELLGGMPGVSPETKYVQELSKFDKVQFVVEKHFPLAWFSAKEAQSLYEKETNDPVGLSTLSTYLARLAERGTLVKSKNSNKVVYRLVSKDLKELLSNP